MEEGMTDECVLGVMKEVGMKVKMKAEMDGGMEEVIFYCLEQ